MAKKDFTNTKLAITAAVAGVTMLTAGWLAQPMGNADDGLTAAADDAVLTDTVSYTSTSTPTTATSAAPCASPRPGPT